MPCSLLAVQSTEQYSIFQFVMSDIFNWITLNTCAWTKLIFSKRENSAKVSFCRIENMYWTRNLTNYIRKFVQFKPLNFQSSKRINMNGLLTQSPGFDVVAFPIQLYENIVISKFWCEHSNPDWRSSYKYVRIMTNGE